MKLIMGKFQANEIFLHKALQIMLEVRIKQKLRFF